MRVPIGNNLTTYNYEGSITKKELSILMKSWGLNPTKQEVQDIMNEIDDSGDGEFDFPEFIEIMSSRMKVRESLIYFSKNTFFSKNVIFPLVFHIYKITHAVEYIIYTIYRMRIRKKKCVTRSE